MCTMTWLYTGGRLIISGFDRTSVNSQGISVFDIIVNICTYARLNDVVISLVNRVQQREVIDYPLPCVNK